MNKNSKNRTFTCIICPRGCDISAELTDDGRLLSVSGNYCARGEQYVRQEIEAPRRTISSSVPVISGNEPLASVRLTEAIPKDMIFTVMEEIRRLSVQAPVKCGEVVVKNICGTGSDLIITRTVEQL